MSDLTGIGKLSEAVEKGTKEIRELAYIFLAPAAKAFGQLIADRVRFARFVNAIRTFQRATEKLKEIGKEPQPVDTKILVPLIEGCSLEEDAEMIEKWANLLASASISRSVQPSYIRILLELSPQEAKICDYIFKTEKPYQKIHETQVYGVPVADIQLEFHLASAELQPFLGNLERLRILMRAYKEPSMTWSSPPLGVTAEDDVGFTPFGRRFMSLCTSGTNSQQEDAVNVANAP